MQLQAAAAAVIVPIIICMVAIVVSGHLRAGGISKETDTCLATTPGSYLMSPPVSSDV